ncbi:hypothetical protein [Pontibacter akesuensis]|uniref:Transporter n=1 Tax=Pontibacter akesuensis TaxID=388950 RepID=A0A1I7H262_9BACT|nr:hypothetical protein [Pontibacter akesuensis]GHA53962.1 hypothetical protein GCM10007389_01510 [Pontibacter akesuensis]SFU54596.1 hypothetical protein SAMN04487941_1428 [Pontibacter akesuensis]
MIRLILAAALLALAAVPAFAQVNVSYHQSSIPFVAVGYEFDRLAPEIRLSTDVYTDDSFSVEAVLPYKFLRREDYFLDAGLGARIGDFDGVVVPVGLSVYPFEKKQFGFHTEVALLSNVGGDLNPILRGSWGITFRFAERAAE